MPSALVLFFILLPVLCWPQTIPFAMVPPYLQLNAYSSIESKKGSSPGHPAALASSSRFTAIILAEQKFLMNELGNYQMAFSLPVAGGGLGFQAGRFGGPLFQNNSISIGYGRKAGDLDLGSQFCFQYQQAAGYSGEVTLSCLAGIAFHPGEEIRAALLLVNPGRSFIGRGKSLLPFGIRSGIGWELSQKFFIATEMENWEGQGASVNLGLTYRFDQRIQARLGHSSFNSSSWMGAGILVHAFQLDASISLHPQLGLSSGITLVYPANIEQ
jgi:hypothetical protein